MVSAGEVSLVTSFFNPGRYGTKKENFERFVDGLGHLKRHLVVVECAFGQEPFEIPSVLTAQQVRCNDVLWQKERLLNAVIDALPSTCTKVAWIDCDVLFEQHAWYDEASRLLDDWPVVQLFSEAVRLPRGEHRFTGAGECSESVASVRSRAPGLLATSDHDTHGHTGFAWAARRDVLQGLGLYESCLTGSADHLMAHAFGGAVSSPCISPIVGRDTPYATHFIAWAEQALARTEGRIGVVPGRLLHLWHGDTQDRQYFTRNIQLQRLGYDPRTDIRRASSGALEWASHKPVLHNWARGFFKWRDEDGARRGVPRASTMSIGAGGQNGFG